MGSELSLILDEEEQALRDSDPEACFRHVIQRGAVALDEVTASLSPRMAAAVHAIAAGERPPAPRPAPARRLHPPEIRPDKPRTLEEDYELAGTRRTLTAHPQLTHMLDAQVLDPGEALRVAQALDQLLGRYVTGTRYAAP